MKYRVCCLIVCFLGCAAAADTWTVDVNGGGDYETIQAAIDASSDGDEIQVMPGTYISPINYVIDTLGKAIWVHSTEGSGVTIIDGLQLSGGIW